MLHAMKGFATTMIDKRILVWVVFLLTSVPCFTLADCDFSDFPTMPEMQVSSLMGDAGYNDKPMMIRSFSADASATALLGYYHRAWKDEYSESVFGVWQQVSSLQGECFMTVQYGQVGDDNTFGRLVISNLPNQPGNSILGDDVMKTQDSIVVSDLKTKDGPKKGRVTVLTSSSSVSELVNFYQTEMQVKGWGLDNNFSQTGNAVLVFRKGLSESNIVIMPAGDATQILINEVDIN